MVNLNLRANMLTGIIYEFNDMCLLWLSAAGWLPARHALSPGLGASVWRAGGQTGKPAAADSLCRPYSTHAAIPRFAGALSRPSGSLNRRWRGLCQPPLRFLPSTTRYLAFQPRKSVDLYQYFWKRPLGHPAVSL